MEKVCTGGAVLLSPEPAVPPGVWIAAAFIRFPPPPPTRSIALLAVESATTAQPGAFILFALPLMQIPNPAGHGPEREAAAPRARMQTLAPFATTPTDL